MLGFLRHLGSVGASVSSKQSMMLEERVDHVSLLKPSLDLKKPPTHLPYSESGALLLENSDGEPVAVFKKNELDESENSSVVYEKIAWILDNGVVPYTELINLELPGLGAGMLQAYIRKNLGTAEDFGPGLFSVDNIHRIGILDIRIGNTDRHFGNLLVVEEDPAAASSSSSSKAAAATMKKMKLIAVDHANSFPALDSAQLGSIRFDWLYWSQASEPFSKETLEMINDIDLKTDVTMLLSFGLPLAKIATLFLSTLLLKKAAKAGLTLKQIGEIMQRDGDRSRPSVFEMMVSESFKSDAFFDTFKKELNLVINQALLGKKTLLLMQ